MQTVIGIDYGTQSARAILVDTASGEVLRSHVVRYPHGVIPGDLASVADYLFALDELLLTMTPEKYRETVVGICVDATSFTLVPIGKDGRALAERSDLIGRKHAQIKLWKCHDAQNQAGEAQALARQRNEPFLGRVGGSIQCEWALPKLIQIRDEDPEIFGQIDLALDLCEYLTYLLTGRIVRSAGSMSYKGLWSRDLSFPSDGYLNALREGFAQEYRRLLRGPVLRPGSRAGTLKPVLCARYGLREGVAVAVGILDGHTAMAALGALKPGDSVLVVGTSGVLTVQTETLAEIPDVCGVAQDGMIPGLYGIETSQSASGDMLEWYMREAVPATVTDEAQQRGISVHQLLSERVRNPWENKLTVADWWNGSRSAPCDLTLPGIICGITLSTRPEDLYLALLQAIVCGTRENVELCTRHGASVTCVRATGGAAQRNPLLMEQYASILNRTVLVGKSTEGPTRGTALYAAVAAGIYETLAEAYANMGEHEFLRYEPDTVHRAEYEALYRRNHTLREMTIQSSMRIR